MKRDRSRLTVRTMFTLLGAVVVLVLSLAACGGDDEAAEPAPAPAEEPAEPPAEEPAPPPAEEPAEPPAEEPAPPPAEEPAGEVVLPPAESLEGLKIAYIQTGSVEYFERSRDGACGAVEALGGECLVFNSEFEPDTEFANMQDALAQGVDGILLFSISRGTLESSARLAEEAGVPVVDFYGYTPDQNADLVGGWIGADAYQVGLLDGEGMVKALGECEGCEVAQVQGLLGRGEVEEYARGFEEIIGAAGYVNVDKPTSNWSRQEAFERMQELIQKFPDLKGVYCHNDDTMVGCVQALRQAGKGPGDLALVTLNASPTGIELIEDGWLQADVGWSPAEEGAMAAHMLSLLIAGVDVEFPVPCHPPLTLVTPDNVADAEPWEPTPELIEEWLTSNCANAG